VKSNPGASFLFSIETNSLSSYPM